jgi:hypothetical protein
MNPLARYKPSKNSNHPCLDLSNMAERELSAFFHAITELFGAEQAELSAEDWLQELIEIDNLPASTHEWRLITAKASTRLASRASASSLPSSLSTEPQMTEPQIA